MAAERVSEAAEKASEPAAKTQIQQSKLVEQGRFNLMCGLKLGKHVWPISPPSCPLILFIISVFFRNLLFTCKKRSIGLGHGLTSVLPGAPTSPSVHKELGGAVKGLDRFNGTLAWGYMGHRE